MYSKDIFNFLLHRNCIQFMENGVAKLFQSNRQNAKRSQNQEEENRSMNKTLKINIQKIEVIIKRVARVIHNGEFAALVAAKRLEIVTCSTPNCKSNDSEVLLIVELY